MKAELSFRFDSLQELHDFTAKMGVPIAVSIPTLAFTTAADRANDEPRAPKTRKITKVAGPDVPAPEPGSVADVPAPEPGSVIVSEADVRAAITAVNDKFGLVPARKVLTQFGAKRIPDLKPEQYADFVKACNTVK